MGPPLIATVSRVQTSQDALLVADLQRLVCHEAVHLLRGVERVPEEELAGVVAGERRVVVAHEPHLELARRAAPLLNVFQPCHAAIAMNTHNNRRSASTHVHGLLIN